MQSFRTAAPQHRTAFWTIATVMLTTGAVMMQMKSFELSAVTALLVAPLAEELFFRGVIQESLLRRGISAGKAIALTALLFAAAHLYASSPGHALATLLPALFIGAVFQQTRRYGLFAALASAVVLHSLFNAAWRAGIATYFSTYMPWFA